MKKSVSEILKSISQIDKSLYDIDFTNTFKKQLNLCFKRNLDLSLFEKVIRILATKGKLPEKYLPHYIKEFDVMECHIKPDWLLMWKQNDKKLTLILTNTGTHSDLFR
ncbi:MAG: type II toxin-antitoxin system YafQ family toxin [Paludibacter sp.]|nr:type II toxin-antitoxin system YafQ family toxin [Paludibacter sp.]